MSASPAATVKPRRIGLALAVAVLAHGAGALLPFPATADPLGARWVLAVTALTTTCWLAAAMPIGVAAMLPLVLLPLGGVQSTRVVAQAYADPILWLFGGGFVLAQAIEKCGLHRRLALRVIAAVGPRPRRLVLGFFLAATLLSFWINNTATALMLLPIATVLVHRTLQLGAFDQHEARRFGACIMCAVAYGASIGGVATPIGTAPNAVFFASYERLVAEGAAPVSFLSWTLAFAPFALVFACLASLVLVHWTLRVPGKALTGSETLLHEAHALPPMSKAERRVAVLFALAVLLWMTRGDVHLGGSDVLHGWAHWLVPEGQPDSFIADGTVAVGIAVATFLVPAGTGDGQRLMDWQSTRNLPYDLLFLLGAGIAMAAAFGPTGLSETVGRALEPLIGAVHPVVLLLVLVATVTTLSEVASNTAIATLFLPIFRDAAGVAKLDPLLLMLPATIAASLGFMLPIATPPNTIVFGSRLITFGQMARAGVAINLLGACVLVPFLWFWVFPLLGVAVGP